MHDPFPGSCFHHASRVVVLSPHCDDAAFSIAGLLRYCRDMGKPISIINFFSCSRYAPTLIVKTQSRVSRIRKQEDSAFAALLGEGCRMVWLEMQEAASRKAYRRREVCTSRPLSAGELRMAAEFSEYLQRNIDRDSAVMIPLGLGFHIDHHIVREAGLSLAAEGFSSLFFYEDLPYAAHYPVDALSNWIAGFCRARGMHLAPCCLTFPDLMAWKQRAVRCYRSQTTSQVWERILGHAERLNPAGPALERFWRLSFLQTRNELYRSPGKNGSSDCSSHG
jgi:LmbE family N-acetylglucosaminyl deacetylase